MKKNATLAALAALLLAGAAQAQQVAVPTFTDPGAYNNYIVGEQRELLKKNLRYISKSAHSDNEKKIANRRLDVVKQNELALARLARLKAYDGDKDFKDKATEALYQQLKVYSVDYKQVDFLAATRTQSYENMEAYFRAMEVAEGKLAAVNDSVNAAQQRFARHHAMTISRDPEVERLDKYIEAVSAVNAYQHQVYLAEFRLEKANARVSDALAAQDAAAFETARQQLVEDAKAAQTALAAVPAFQGKDALYRDATRRMADFYGGLAANQYVRVKELVEKKNTLSKAEATEFNSFVAFYNKESQRVGQAYNQAANAFQATYIPVFND
ncbi:hypothetical protein [uncultured Hymenobacter sp.]|uniref:LIC11966 family surface protein n=1 Tax=uncultured Hymenobacter sp. TaxID=170016 RepID=UPI0035CB4DDC